MTLEISKSWTHARSPFLLWRRCYEWKMKTLKRVIYRWIYTHMGCRDSKIIMRKVFSLIIVLLTGFFPYMPIVHADYISTVGHCSMIEDAHSHDKNAHHDMNLCTKIVQEIIGNNGAISEMPPISSLILKRLSFEEILSSILVQKKTETIIHETDPPHFDSQDFVWIIKLTI